MNMNQLVEYLETGIKNWEECKDQFPEGSEGRNLRSLNITMAQALAILKAIQFKGNLEILAHAGCEPGMESPGIENPDDPNDQELYAIRWWDGKQWRFSYANDYCSAAIKAVEEFQEKSQ